jgi:hypothetical protein
MIMDRLKYDDREFENSDKGRYQTAAEFWEGTIINQGRGN